jgi:predicted HTH domain antitoxin
MGAKLDDAAMRLELAVSLFDRGQIGIGVAARIAGLTISELIDELGRRRIPVVRTSAEDLERELAAFGD